MKKNSNSGYKEVQSDKKSNKEFSIDIIYEKTIKKVMDIMKPSMKSCGYSDSTIEKIEPSWRKNLKKEPKTEFANLTKQRDTIKIEPKPEVIFQSVQIAEDVRPPTPSEYSNSSELEEDYRDPTLDEFHKVKQENIEAEKKETIKEEEKESDIDDQIDISDDDTKLDDPEAQVYIHALYEEVKRKKTAWNVKLISSVIQKLGTSEKLYKNINGHFDSKKKD